jgi:hypothetical protein
LHNFIQNQDTQFQRKPFRSAINFSFANIQPKLKVSEPGDVYEQEADRVAEKVMEMSRDSDSELLIKDSDYGRVNLKCTRCEEKEDEVKVSRKPLSTEGNLNNSEELTREINNVRI